MYYRLYFLNAAQQIAARDEFEAENDETAITIAGLNPMPAPISARVLNSGKARAA